MDASQLLFADRHGIGWNEQRVESDGYPVIIAMLEIVMVENSRFSLRICKRNGALIICHGVIVAMIYVVRFNYGSSREPLSIDDIDMRVVLHAQPLLLQK